MGDEQMERPKFIISPGAAYCFTGHRPEKFSFADENDERCRAIKAEIWHQIFLLNKRGVRQFFSDLARGVDTWAAEEVLKLNDMAEAGIYPGLQRMQLFGIVPFDGQCEKWRHEDQLRYYELIKRMTHVVSLQEQYSADCYFRRNQFMVDCCQHILVVYNENENAHSGTRQTVEYARRMRRVMIMINPKTAKVTARI